MTTPEVSPARIAAAFDFARRQRDPAFRQYLRDIGWTQGHHVVITDDNEPVAAIVARMIYNETSSPCLVAFPYPGEQFGFRLMFAEVVPVRRRQRREPPIPIGRDASVGMVYSSLRRCGEFAPSEWARPVRFARVDTAA